MSRINGRLTGVVAGIETSAAFARMFAAKGALGHKLLGGLGRVIGGAARVSETVRAGAKSVGHVVGGRSTPPGNQVRR